MKTFIHSRRALPFGKDMLKTAAFCTALCLLWHYLPGLIRYMQPTAGLLDAGIFQLLFLAALTFMIICVLVWWLLLTFWTSMQLAPLQTLVSHFNSCTPWQQFGFYWASYALLLLAAILCLSAIV